MVRPQRQRHRWRLALFVLLTTTLLAPPLPARAGSAESCCSTHSAGGCADEACAACVCDIQPGCCVSDWDRFCVATAEDDCSASCPCAATPTPTVTPAGGDCCEVHAGASCDDAACAACVCGKDAACCESTWDATCLSEAVIDCALECPCAGIGECCSAHDGVSCEGLSCKTCVCGEDPVCCSEAWDDQCAMKAASDCNAACDCVPSGDCCSAHAGGGCDESGCESCVCALDDFCCTNGWDEGCAAAARTRCTAECTTCPPSNCCGAHAEAGCNEPTCAACVCDVDAFCCDEQWDGSCVAISRSDCASECACSPACPGDCGADDTVAVNELIIAVNIALGNAPVDDCSAIDTNGDGQVTVNELIQAVNAALNGCPA